MQVVKECPNLADPYHTLGLLHEAQGNSRRALDLYMIAAHLTPSDIQVGRSSGRLVTAAEWLLCLGVSHF